MTKSKPRAKSSPERPLRILFLHPDLGIGGAERLILDAALGLQSLGHSITIYTSHCDPNHCFDEARDGTLAVKVAGNSIVPASVLGGFKILCAILRQFHLLLYLYFSGTLASLNPDIVVMDQLSAGLGVLRLLAPDVRSLFYIHFPDKLLASREGVLRAAYRIPFDAFEGLTTGLADGLVVNSKFTRGVVQGAFTELRGRDLRVVYPCVDARDTGKMEVETLWGGMKVVVSVNRFERKKGVELAIKAFAGLKPEERKGVRLVLAGGYDTRVLENVEYHLELVSLAESLNLKTITTKTIVTALDVPSDIQVLFLLSVPAPLKASLLHTARLLLYTPANEHFGIVPLEAMLAGTPVLAADSGGPLETVIDNETGWLRPVDDTAAWTKIMRSVLWELNDSQLQQIGARGVERVKAQFSSEKMAQDLEDVVEGLVQKPRRDGMRQWWILMALLQLGLFVGIRGLIWGYRSWSS